MTDKRVVIIGAGFFGISTANRLARSTNFKIILITISKNAYFLISSIRAPVQNKTEYTFIPIKDVVDQRVQVIQDKVSEFTENEVILQNHETLSFDALVVATGASWADPIGSNLKFKDDYESYFQERHEEFENAKHIVLVGGGFNNCELLGELIFKYKDELKFGMKKLTMLHSRPLLLPDDGFYSDFLRKGVTDFVKSQDVDLKLNSRAKPLDSDPNSLAINGDVNRTIKGDLIVYSTGTIPAVPNHSISQLCNTKSFIRINESFQVKAVSNGKVFSIGDVTDFEYRGLMIRKPWLEAITKNIKLIVQDLHVQESKLSKVKRPKGHITSFFSMGPEHGFGQICIPWIGTIKAPQWYVIRMKSRDLATSFAKVLYNS